MDLTKFTPARQLLVLNAAVILMLLTLWAVLPAQWSQNQNFDYSTYYEPVARRVLAGAGLREASGAAATHYPPGFSLLLAAVFGLGKSFHIGDDRALKIFILACSAIAVTSVYGIAAAALGRSIGFVAGAMWTTYPVFLWLGKQPNSETPFMTFLLPALYLFARSWHAPRNLSWYAAAVGFLLGLATLTRAMTVALCIVLCLLVMIRLKEWPVAQRARYCAILLAINVLTMVPWEWWMWHDTGRFIFVASSSHHAVWDGLTFAARPEGSGILLPVSPKVRAIMLEADAQDENTIGTISGMLGFLTHKASQDPSAVIDLLFLKARRAWFGTQAQWLESATAAMQIVYLALAMMGAVIAWRASPEGRRFTWFALGCVGYFWGMAVIALPLLRYMTPVMSLVIILAAVAVTRAGERVFRQAARVV